MNSGSDLLEKRSDTVYFSFGRFQPPTLGHKILIDEIANKALTDNADAYIFLSSSKDRKKNPLNITKKEKWIKKVVSNKNIRFINTTTCLNGTPCTNLGNIINLLINLGYVNIIMVVGSDRVPAFAWLTTHYDNVSVIPHSEERNMIYGISGTKMREAALRNNLNAIEKGTGLSKNNASTLMQNIKNGMRGGKYTRKQHKL